MKQALTLFLLFICQHCFSQCPFTVTLKNNGSTCLGRDTLAVSAPGSIISKIVWYNGSIVDTTLMAITGNGYNPMGITVAGGNGQGSAANQLNAPYSVFVDAKGYIYIGDDGNQRVQKFPPGSSSVTNGVTIAGGNGVGSNANQFYNPVSIFVDGSGNLFAADEGNNRVQKFLPGSLTGITVAGGNGAGVGYNQFNGPSSVFIDAGGYIYVVDLLNERIMKFPPGSTSATNGVVVAGGNGQGYGGNQFNYPASVYIDASGYIYVADQINNRIQKFPPNSTSATYGVTVAGGNSYGSKANQLSSPSAVFVDASGYIYVADELNNRVQKFPPNSSILTNGITVGGGNGGGSGANQLSYPLSVNVDSEGNIYVADPGNNRIQKFSPTTTIDTVLVPKTPGTYTAVVSDSAGCTVTTNAITIYPNVTPAISISTVANTLPPCTSQLLDTVQFTATATNGGTAPVYQWQVNGTNAGTNSPTFTSALANNSVVACILTSNALCATTPVATSNLDTVRFVTSALAILKSKGGVCLGGDTLVVSAPGSTLSKILWYNGQTIDTVVNAGSTAIGTTVAGGNGGGTKGNQLQYPTGVYVDATGSIYIADAANERIQKFPAGSNSATMGITAAGGNLAGKAANQFNNPNSLFVDGGGNIYVADEQNHRIQEFPPYSTSATNGKTVAGGQDSGSAAYLLKYPSSVYVDGAGYIYVADNGNNRIQKFTPGYAFAQTVAGGNGYGAAANQLNSPASVFVDGQGNVYVADLGNNRIQKFPPGSNSSTNGTTVAGGNGPGTAPNQLSLPSSVFVDAAGNLYVADKINGRIQKFPPNSTSSTYGTTVAGGNGLGPATNQLDNPDGLFVDAKGNIYVADDANNRIQKFTPGGMSIIDTVLVPTAPGTYNAVVTSNDGCTDTTNAITVYPQVAAIINISAIANAHPPCALLDTDTLKFTAVTANAGAAPVYQWLVNGTKAGTNNAAFTANLANGSNVQCILTSNAVCITNPTDTSNTYIVDLGGPHTFTLQNKGSICLGNDTLLINGQNSPIAKIIWYNGSKADTTVTAHVKYIPKAVTVAGGNGAGNTATQLFSPASAYVDDDGNLYVADEQNDRIQKFLPGSTSVTPGSTIAGGNGQGSAANQLNSPHSTFLDAAGNIYIADIYNNRVQKFPPGSTSATNGATAAGGNGNGDAANQLNAPASAFVDGAGNLYVADQVNNRIQKFPPGSTGSTPGITVAGGNGTGSAGNQFNIPYSVCVDGGGNIYVADEVNERIQKFPPGSDSSTMGTTVAGGNGQGSDATHLKSPIAVYVDGSGDIFVADLGNNRIQEFLPGSTAGITVAGGNGKGDGDNQLNAPVGVFVNASGNIFVADQQNNRIQKFTVYKVLTVDTFYTPADPGTYTAVVIDSASCTDTTNAIIIYPTPKASINIGADKTTICAGGAITFTAIATNAGNTPSYQWLVNGIAHGTNGPGYTNASLKDGDVVACIVSNTDGCILPDTSNPITAHVLPLPVVGHANDVVIAPGQSTTILLPVTGNIASYAWEPPTGLDKTDIANPVASPGKTTLYTLTVQSTDGCTAWGNVKVVVAYPIIVPGAFTPNGDGHNDIFYVLGGYPGDIIKDFTVFGRWGQKLFQVQHVVPNDPANGWDGTVNGKPQQPGAYVYVLRISAADGTEKVFKGTVVLVR